MFGVLVMLSWQSWGGFPTRLVCGFGAIWMCSRFWFLGGLLVGSFVEFRLVWVPFWFGCLAGMPFVPADAWRFVVVVVSAVGWVRLLLILVSLGCFVYAFLVVGRFGISARLNLVVCGNRLVGFGGVIGLFTERSYLCSDLRVLVVWMGCSDVVGFGC